MLSSKVCAAGQCSSGICRGLTSALFDISFFFVFRFDEAALSIQKEKNIYKEIENYPTCYKVFFEYVWLDFTLDILHIGIKYSS